MNTQLFLSYLFLTASLWACSTEKRSHDIFDRLTYYQPEDYEDSLLVGTFPVHENRITRKGRKINLYVAVTPALVRDSLKEPIFMIDGGPGVGVSHQSYFYTEEDTNYRRYHDIVYVDARGTGKSSPLNCLAIQSKQSPQEYFADPYRKSELDACLETLRDSVDFNFYQTKYIVEDLEEVRRWLGYEKINLLAISFGGKVALQYMDRYPESIHRVVLHAPDAPNIDYLSWRGRYSQRALDILFENCRQDSSCHANYPDLNQEFEGLKTRFKREAVRHELIANDSTYTIEMSWPPVAAKIASMLYNDFNYIQIPYIIHEAYRENYTPLLEAMNVTSTDTSYVFADGMWLSNVCSEDIALATINYKEEELESFLGDYIYQTRKNACDHWPVEIVDASHYRPVVSDIKTLILSGNMDPTLPPETGAEIAKNLSNCQHIVIPYMAHMFGDLTNLDCYDHHVVAFFEDREDHLSISCFNEMKPRSFKIPAQVE